MLATRKNGVNVLFECDVATLFRIIDNARTGSLCAKLKTLEDSAVIVGIVNLTAFLKLLCLRLIVLEGVFKVIV